MLEEVVRMWTTDVLDLPGCEVVRISSVLTVHGVISAGVVRTLDPDLSKVAVPALALRLGVRDDDIDAGEKLAGLHEGQGVGTASLHEGYSVMPQSPQVNEDRGGVWRGGALQADGDILSAAE